MLNLSFDGSSIKSETGVNMRLAVQQHMNIRLGMNWPWLNANTFSNSNWIAFEENSMCVKLISTWYMRTKSRVQKCSEANEYVPSKTQFLK